METVVPFLQQTLRGLPKDHCDRPVVTGLLADVQRQLWLGSFPVSSTQVSVFPEEARRVLVGDGAVTYLLAGETVRGQRAAGRPFWYVAPGYEIGGKNRLTDVPSSLVEVAFYPDPDRFFVPGSVDRSRVEREALRLEDRDSLIRRLGNIGVDQVPLEVSGVTELVFKHFDATRGKVRLLGGAYGYHWVDTNTPADKKGLHFAYVGDWKDVEGLRIDDWAVDEGAWGLGAGRWIVPAEVR